MALPEAVARIQIETHRFVRHQMTWFRKMGELVWFDLGERDAGEIVQFTAEWIDEENMQGSLSS
jgi:tRNA dimethylallyltransferase